MAPKILTTAFWCLGVVGAAAQQPLGFDRQRIDQLLESEMNRWKVPGCALAIVNSSGVLYIKGYGFRNVEKSNVNKRRTSVGHEPLEDYAKRFGIDYTPPRPK